jgi:hypothetical protein
MGGDEELDAGDKEEEEDEEDDEEEEEDAEEEDEEVVSDDDGESASTVVISTSCEPSRKESLASPGWEEVKVSSTLIGTAVKDDVGAGARTMRISSC